MLCFNCDKYELTEKTTILSMDFDERIIVIKKVPASVCDQCGAEYIEPLIDTQIREIVDKIVKSKNITGVVVLDFSKEIEN